MEEKAKLGTYVMKRVAEGAHLPTPLIVPAKRRWGRLLLGLQFLPLVRTQALIFAVEWTGARSPAENVADSGEVSTQRPRETSSGLERVSNPEPLGSFNALPSPHRMYGAVLQ